MVDFFAIDVNGISILGTKHEGLFDDYGTVFAFFQFGRIEIIIWYIVDRKYDVHPVSVGSEFDHWSTVAIVASVLHTVCDSSD